MLKAVRNFGLELVRTLGAIFVEVFSPELEGDVICAGVEGVVFVVVFVSPEKGVHKGFEIVVYVTPNRHTLIFYRIQLPIIIAVHQKGSKFTRINMCRQKRQQIHIKLKRGRKLHKQLMHTV